MIYFKNLYNTTFDKYDSFIEGKVFPLETPEYIRLRSTDRKIHEICGNIINSTTTEELQKKLKVSINEFITLKPEPINERLYKKTTEFVPTLLFLGFSISILIKNYSLMPIIFVVSNLFNQYLKSQIDKTEAFRKEFGQYFTFASEKELASLSVSELANNSKLGTDIVFVSAKDFNKDCLEVLINEAQDKSNTNSEKTLFPILIQFDSNQKFALLIIDCEKRILEFYGNKNILSSHHNNDIFSQYSVLQETQLSVPFLKEKLNSENTEISKKTSGYQIKYLAQNPRSSGFSIFGIVVLLFQRLKNPSFNSNSELLTSQVYEDLNKEQYIPDNLLMKLNLVKHYKRQLKGIFTDLPIDSQLAAQKNLSDIWLDDLLRFNFISKEIKTSLDNQLSEIEQYLSRTLSEREKQYKNISLRTSELNKRVFNFQIDDKHQILTSSDQTQLSNIHLAEGINQESQKNEAIQTLTQTLDALNKTKQANEEKLKQLVEGSDSITSQVLKNKEEIVTLMEQIKKQVEELSLMRENNFKDLRLQIREIFFNKFRLRIETDVQAFVSETEQHQNTNEGSTSSLLKPKGIAEQIRIQLQFFETQIQNQFNNFDSQIRKMSNLSESLEKYVVDSDQLQKGLDELKAKNDFINHLKLIEKKSDEISSKIEEIKGMKFSEEASLEEPSSTPFNDISFKQTSYQLVSLSQQQQAALAEFLIQQGITDNKGPQTFGLIKLKPTDSSE